MSGGKARDGDGFDLDNELTEQKTKKNLHVTDSDIRRRLDDQLEENRLKKILQDYDFDLD
jgi:hypothetical protein